MEEEPGAEVIPFERGDRAPLRHRPRYIPSKPYCPHNQAELEPTNRRVYCRACKEELDPYEVLSKLAHEHERWESERDRAKADAKYASDYLLRLKKELRNIKGQLRQAMKNQ